MTAVGADAPLIGRTSVERADGSLIAERWEGPVVVVGASAGGIEALSSLMAALPGDLGAAVAVVVHLSPSRPSRLDEVVSRAGPFMARFAVDGGCVERSVIDMAPPDHHLILDSGHTRLSRGPRRNRSRPSIDVLFRSAAASYGRLVVGVLLSGVLSDGVAGLQSISESQGLCLVQDPRQARFSGMPNAAIRAGVADAVEPVDDLARRVVAHVDSHRQGGHRRGR